MSFKNKIKALFQYFSPIQIVVFYYLMMILIAFFLLQMPFFLKENQNILLIDHLFMAISSVSVTGLTTFNIGETYNHAGIILLEILFQVGGLGITMISTFLLIMTRRKISLKQRQLIMVDMNQPRLSGIVRLIRSTFAILLGLQLIFGLVFGFYFYFAQYQSKLSTALFDGFYTAISAVTNSGFDMTGDSLKPFKQQHFFLLIVMVLIFLGGIGFPVLMEVKEWLVLKKNKTKMTYFRFSLFTKLAVSSFVVLFLIGTVLIYLIERDHYFLNHSFGDALTSSMFYSISTRNAGIQLNNLNDFTTPTQLLFSVLMFVGASPSSVGGGVRTTTITILILYLFTFIRSRENLNVFNRRISDADIKKSIVVVNLSLFMCALAVLILSGTERQSLVALIFEVCSAFGTTGLSLGITADLSIVGKIVIMLLMFIGRIGMLYTLMMFVSKEKSDTHYLYPTEQIIIG